MISLLSHMFKYLKSNPKGQWLLPGLFFLSLFFYSTSGYMFFEIESKPDLSWEDAAWWSVVTMTTVGYGDYFPESTYGRMLVGIPTMLLGVSLLGYILSLLASMIVEVRYKELRGMAQITFSNHIIICTYPGLGTMKNLINELRSDPSTQKSHVVLIDENLDEIPTELQREGVLFVKGNPARENTLMQANLPAVKFAVIMNDLKNQDHSDEKNLPIALTIERLCPEVKTIVHCLNPENQTYFHHANVDSVICTDSLSAQFIVQEMQDPGIHSVFTELTSNTQGRQCYIVDLPDNLKTFSAVKTFCSDKNIIPIGLQRKMENILAPEDSYTVNPGDRLISIAAKRPSLV